MKFYISFSLLIIIVIFSCQDKSEIDKNESIESFSEKIIQNLINKNWESMSNDLVSLDDIKNIYQIAQLSKGNSQEKIDSVFINNPKTNEISKALISEVKLSFDKIITEGENNGIIWKNIVYSGCNYTLIKNGIEEIDLKIKYTYKGNLYELNIPQVVRTNGGLKISSPIYSLEESHKEIMKRTIEEAEKRLMDSVARTMTK